MGNTHTHTLIFFSFQGAFLQVADKLWLNFDATWFISSSGLKSGLQSTNSLALSTRLTKMPELILIHTVQCNRSITHQYFQKESEASCPVFRMLSEKTWIHMSFTWLYRQWLQCVSLMCCCVVCAAAMQLCSIQCCCLVTACWAGERIKCCRCVWGNLWRAFEEGVSHSSWSSSRTESWTSHLLRGFYPHNTSLCLTATIETVREH